MSRIKASALAAVLAAVYAIIAQVAIPFPGVPLTFQCFAVALGGYVLGWRIGLMSTVLYIAIGAVGLPVFSGFRGGIEALLGATGGFIWGFAVLSVLCGLGRGKKRLASFSLGLLGLICCHAIGVLQFSLVTGSAPVSSFLVASAPYIIKDALLLWVAITISPSIYRAIFHKR